jgi:hypothetical protein
MLNALGFRAGALGGGVGDEQAALSYQAHRQFEEPTGTLDDPTQDALEKEHVVDRVAQT